MTDGYSAVLGAGADSTLQIAQLLPPVAATAAAAVAVTADGGISWRAEWGGAGRGRCTAGGRPSGGVWVDSV